MIIYLSMPEQHVGLLGRLRHWEGLMAARSEGTVWIRDITQAQLERMEMRSLLYKTLYYEKEGRLFKWGSLLPECAVPSLLWTPMESLLPVRLPSFNHNYFGVQSTVSFVLQPSGVEQPSFALITGMEDLAAYIIGASFARLQPLRWVVAGEMALLLGTPLLSLRGETFWRSGNFLYPTGVAPEFPILETTLDGTINPGAVSWVVWDRQGAYTLIEKSNFLPLTIGSFRQTVQRNAR